MTVPCLKGVDEVRENADFSWPTKEKETVQNNIQKTTQGLETTLTCPSSHSWNLGWKDFTGAIKGPQLLLAFSGLCIESQECLQKSRSVIVSIQMFFLNAFLWFCCVSLPASPPVVQAQFEQLCTHL